MRVLGSIFIAWCVHHGDHELETVSLPCVVRCLATRVCSVCVWCVRARALAVCQPEGAPCVVSAPGVSDTATKRKHGFLFGLPSMFLKCCLTVVIVISFFFLPK